VRQRLLDVLAMHRLAHRPDSGSALLRWLARRTGCWAGLLDGSGAVLAETSPGLPPAATSLLTRALEEMLDRDLPTFSVDDGPGSRAVLLAVDVPTGGRGPVLAIFGPNRVPAALLTDAAVVLATSWSKEETQRIRTQVEIAEARCREAVLHLLTSRNLSIARQLASTLSPALPDRLRVYLIESAPQRRGEVVDRCAELTDGKAWTVRCPVHSGHVIVLAPASVGPEPDHRPLEDALSSEIGGCVVGAGDVVRLVDTAVGYEQAFHALAVARGLPERSARFDAALDLPTVVGLPGFAWATAFLAPLITHVPARAGDPDAQELTATARSWLSFSTGATRHLKIHRNTLTTRLRGLEELLGRDLARTGEQAALDLALRIRAAPSHADPGAAAPADGDLDLDGLLRLPRTQQWAQATLRPIHESAQASVLESTLRVWLDCDSRLSATAEVLDLSVAGTRKRVMRLEQVLGRSLLQPPSARYDLWMAVRATDFGA
jgi:sugar diacid utilization regulator